ncbi:MAG TPA: glycosyltransferase family 2 protein [Thermodesulfobacteriota bacterium]|nr:glycosyltransferase family 2 protein [Thermodesulfobacteriota bacterium]
MEAVRPEISVVAPAYNEAATLEPLVEGLHRALAPLGRPYEIVLVDDGSTDDTGRVIERLAAADPRVRGVWLAANAGQSAALFAGFEAARGEILVTIDADLQNDPADVPSLLAALEGADAVCGIRRPRCDPLATRLASRVANWLRDRLLHDGIVDTGCSLKALRRRDALRLPLFRGMHRFIPALLQLEGRRVAQVPVRHAPRRAGVSKYRAVRGRALQGLVDLLGVFWLKRRRPVYRVERRSP